MMIVLGHSTRHCVWPVCPGALRAHSQEHLGSLCRHPRESGDPVLRSDSLGRCLRRIAGASPSRNACVYWVPAFAGVTAERMRVLFRTVVYRGPGGERPLAKCRQHQGPAPARHYAAGASPFRNARHRLASSGKSRPGPAHSIRTAGQRCFILPA